MTRLITVVKGLGSALLLAAFIVGVPAVMVRIGAFPTGPLPCTTTTSPNLGGTTPSRPCTTVGPAHPKEITCSTDTPSGTRTMVDPGCR